MLLIGSRACEPVIFPNGTFILEKASHMRSGIPYGIFFIISYKEYGQKNVSDHSLMPAVYILCRFQIASSLEFCAFITRIELVLKIFYKLRLADEVSLPRLPRENLISSSSSLSAVQQSLTLRVARISFLSSFRPERALFRPGGVNLRACLCGVQSYTSTQSLDFLARTKNPSFPNRKLLVSHPEFPDGH